MTTTKHFVSILCRGAKVGLGVGVLGGVLALCWLPFGHSKTDANAMSISSSLDPVTVDAVRVRKATVRQYVYADGIATALRREFLRFEVTGRVVKIGVDDDGAPLREGSFVRGPAGTDAKGTLLAEVDSRRYEIAVQRAQAELEQARQTIAISRAERSQATSELEYCRANSERHRRLFGSKAIPQEAMDEARRRLNAATANLRALDARIQSLEAARETAAASLSHAELDLEHTKLYATFDGVIARRNTNLGDYAAAPSAGASSKDACLETCAFVVMDPDVFEMTLHFSLIDGFKVAVGQDAWVRRHESQRMNDATPASTETRAVVHSVSRLLTKERHLVRVKLRTRDASSDFFGGERVSARICVRSDPTATVIPRTALCYRGDDPYCYVIDTDQSIATKRIVTVGEAEGELVEVVRGLEVDELVATQGRQRLTDASSVRIADGR